MGGARSHSDFIFFGKSSQNSPKQLLIFLNSRLICLYTFLKVVGYYDLSVVMGFQKKQANG